MPVADTGPRSPGKTLFGIALLQVVRIEVDRRIGTQCERERLRPVPAVVHRDDADFTGLDGMIDDPSESLPIGVRGGGEIRTGWCG